MAPAIGVPNIEAKPALIPQITSFLRSLLFNFRVMFENSHLKMLKCGYG